MDVPAVHPSRGTVGTAHGAGAVRSNERLGHNAKSTIDGCGANKAAIQIIDVGVPSVSGLDATFDLVKLHQINPNLKVSLDRAKNLETASGISAPAVLG